MLNLLNYGPLESYFQGRLWWKSSILRVTTGFSNPQDIITVTNLPCFIYEFHQSTTSTDYSHFPSSERFNIIIPARFVSKSNPSDIISIDWGPNQHIYTQDVIFIYGVPFLLVIQELSNPLTLYSHYEIIASQSPHSFRLTSKPIIALSSYSYIEPPEDILNDTLQVASLLLNQLSL